MHRTGRPLDDRGGRRSRSVRRAPRRDAAGDAGAPPGERMPEIKCWWPQALVPPQVKVAAAIADAGSADDSSAARSHPAAAAAGRGGSGVLARRLFLTGSGCPLPDLSFFSSSKRLRNPPRSNTPDLSRELRKSVRHLREQNMPPSSMHARVRHAVRIGRQHLVAAEFEDVERLVLWKRFPALLAQHAHGTNPFANPKSAIRRSAIGTLSRCREFNVNCLGFTLAKFEFHRRVANRGEKFGVAGLAVFEPLHRHDQVVRAAGSAVIR